MKRSLRLSYLIAVVLVSCFLNNIQAQSLNNTYHSISITTTKDGDKKQQTKQYKGIEAERFDVEKYLLNNLNQRMWFYSQTSTDSEITITRFSTEKATDLYNTKHFTKQLEEQKQKSILGVGISKTTDFEGVYVDRIIDNPTIDASAFRVGDIIQQVEGLEIRSSCDLSKAIHDFEAGDYVTILTLRGNQLLEQEVKLGYKVESNYIWVPTTREILSESNLSEVKSLNLYPNPNNGTFQLEFASPSKEDVEITIFDVLGKHIYSKKINNFDGFYNKAIHLNQTEAGIYFMQIKQGNEIHEQRLIIQ